METSGLVDIIIWVLSIMFKEESGGEKWWVKGWVFEGIREQCMDETWNFEACIVWLLMAMEIPMFLPRSSSSLPFVFLLSLFISLHTQFQVFQTCQILLIQHQKRVYNNNHTVFNFCFVCIFFNSWIIY